MILIFEPIIKWSGSKRSQAEQIISYFPKEIDTYYEPFVGGGSILRQLLQSNIKVNKYICSDINKTLIEIWNEILNNPENIILNYKKMWKELNQEKNLERKKEYYYKIRNRFNKFQSIYDFIFLNRTCTNGLIRYNSKGEFNTSFHFSRNGINPTSFEKIVYEWSEILIKNDVIFKCNSYENIISSDNDVLYLDPPYANTKGMYYGTIEYKSFWDWIRKQKGKYFLSFDGKTTSKDNTYQIPNDIYSEHFYTNSNISGFMKLHKEIEYVKESLYIK